MQTNLNITSIEEINEIDMLELFDIEQYNKIQKSNSNNNIKTNSSIEISLSELLNLFSNIVKDSNIKLKINIIKN